MQRVIKAGESLIKYFCKECKRQDCWDDDCKLIKELKNSINDYKKNNSQKYLF